MLPLLFCLNHYKQRCAVKRCKLSSIICLEEAEYPDFPGSDSGFFLEIAGQWSRKDL